MPVQLTEAFIAGEQLKVTQSNIGQCMPSKTQWPDGTRLNVLNHLLTMDLSSPARPQKLSILRTWRPRRRSNLSWISLHTTTLPRGGASLVGYSPRWTMMGQIATRVSRQTFPSSLFCSYSAAHPHLTWLLACTWSFSISTLRSPCCKAETYTSVRGLLSCLFFECASRSLLLEMPFLLLHLPQTIHLPPNGSPRLPPLRPYKVRRQAYGSGMTRIW